MSGYSALVRVAGAFPRRSQRLQLRAYVVVGAFAVSLGGAPGDGEAQDMAGWFTSAPVQPAAAPTVAMAAPPPMMPALAPMPGDVFEVVPLKYADVSEIVGLLTGNQTVKPNDNFTPQEPNFGSSGTQLGYGGGGGLPSAPFSSPASNFVPNAEPLGRAVDATVGIDRRLNAVVLRGPQSTIDAFKSEIRALDVPVTSVVLETQFVELTEAGARNLGLDFNNGNNQIASGSYVYAKGFPGLADTPKVGGFTVGLQAALYAQIAKGEGRIVSTPRIAAQSGTMAKIVTGDALPILTSIALSGVNAVQQQVQYVNVGVTLQIAPRVSNDGMVTSHIFAVVSSVTGFSQGYPTISQREASTSATVRDGEPFVIGGLTQDSSIVNESKIPLLGDIPLLGLLATTEHTNKTKRDLYIVVTPHIVRAEATENLDKTKL